MRTLVILANHMPVGFFEREREKVRQRLIGREKRGRTGAIALDVLFLLLDEKYLLSLTSHDTAHFLCGEQDVQYT